MPCCRFTLILVPAELALSLPAIMPIVPFGRRKPPRRFAGGIAMFRRVITSYLIAMTLAGPGLCCCTVSRVFGRDCEHACCRPATKPDSGSCCHSHPAKRPPTTPDECPCRKYYEQQLVVPDNEASPPSDALGVRNRPVSLDSMAAVIGSPLSASDRNQLSRRVLVSPYPSSSDLLRALSVMRC